MDTLRGKVKKIIFKDYTYNFVVAVVRSDIGDVTIVGDMPFLKEGMKGEFEGRWEYSAKYGKRFRAEIFKEAFPTTVEGIRRYLKSGMIEGIGREIADRIVEEFGDKTFHIIDKDPYELLKIKGIGMKRCRKIIESWKSHKEARETLVFLYSLGLGPATATKIYKKYGKSTISKIKRNPYILASEVSGIGFKKADEVAFSLGVSKDSLDRGEAVLKYTLLKGLDEGHCYLPMDVLRKRVEENDVKEELLQKAISRLSAKGDVVVENDRVYLSHIHFKEETVAKKISNLLKKKPKDFTSFIDKAWEIIVRINDFLSYGPPLNLELDVGKTLDTSIKKMGIHLSYEQREALYMALTNQMSIITGGPGVGKTTILKVLINVLERMGNCYALASPTGRAARRMAESIGREAYTIHRLLGYNPHLERFEYNAQTPLRREWIILDEASMIDLPLFYHLLSALEEDCRLLLVGDVDQLPSVGAGSVLKDLIETQKVPTYRLTKIYRQKEGSLIIKNAHRINQGLMPILPSQKENLYDFYFVETEDSERIEDLIVKIVSQRIPFRFGLDPIKDVQVITPMIKRVAGVESLNKKLQEALNPTGKPIGVYRIGDKVMQQQNNYEKDVFNGDIGIVHGVDEEGNMLVDFDGRIVTYTHEQKNQLKLSYSCTVHKSQGSEFPAVVMPLHMGHFVMLARNLLYTAITRAKRLVVLVGSKKALATAVKNDKIVHRYTTLKEKILKNL